MECVKSITVTNLITQQPAATDITTHALHLPLAMTPQWQSVESRELSVLIPALVKLHVIKVIKTMSQIVVELFWRMNVFQINSSIRKLALNKEEHKRS